MPDSTYQVTLGEQVVRVRLRKHGDDLFARLDDGEERPVSLVHVRGALYSLTLGARRFEFLGTVTDGEVSLAINGTEYRAEVVDEARARLASVAGASATHHRRELRAPMPGLLVKVLVQSGDTVEGNQPLAVLQAMKMENELLLPRGGTVVAVNVEAGQTVEQGQVLIIVE